MRTPRTFRRAAALVLAGLLLTACGGDGGSRSLVVYAPRSLADAFRALADAFEEATPGVEVSLELGESASLQEEVLSGAAGDVYVSVGGADMAQVEQAGAAAGSSQLLARNPLAIVVPFDNPAGIATLEDLAGPGLAIGLCSEDLPVGAAARQALAAAGVTPSLDVDEPDVRSLLTDIENGELDAGIMYASDVVGEAGYVDGFVIPDAYQAELAYSIVALSEAAHPEEGGQFVAFSLSAAGQQVLAEYGLQSP